LGFGGFTGSWLLQRSYLSQFGFILPCWTIMFLCIILYNFLFSSKRAQDHQKRSPGSKVIEVFVQCCPVFLLERKFRPKFRPKFRSGSVTCVSICRKFRWGRESGPNGQFFLVLFKGGFFPNGSLSFELVFAHHC